MDTPANSQLGQQKTVAELAALDQVSLGVRDFADRQEDESLQRWKASLGLTGNAGGGGAKRIVPKTLFLTSPTRSQDIIIDLTQSKEALAKLKKEPGGCCDNREGRGARRGVASREWAVEGWRYEHWLTSQ